MGQRRRHRSLPSDTARAWFATFLESRNRHKQARSARAELRPAGVATTAAVVALVGGRGEAHIDLASFRGLSTRRPALAWLLNRKLKFDPSREAFIDDDEANGLRSRPARDPFSV